MNRMIIVAVVSAIVLISGGIILGVRNSDTATQGATTDQAVSDTQTNQAPATPQAEGPPTIVEKGKSIEDHVEAYFDAYKDNRLDDAFEMQPAENKVKQPKDQFIPLREGMPITDYTMRPTSKNGDQSVIEVEYELSEYGTWVSTWTFEKQDGSWVALRYLASPKQ